jgi:hypothetical protein
VPDWLKSFVLAVAAVVVGRAAPTSRCTVSQKGSGESCPDPLVFFEGWRFGRLDA